MVSGILYLLYNSDLPKITDIKSEECTLLFVDNAAIIVMGKDFTAAHKKLCSVMTRANSIFDWAATHNCKLGMEKFQLLDFTRKSIPHPLNPWIKIPTPRKKLRLDNHRIPSKETAKFLGILVDNRLNWKVQGAAALAIHAKYLCHLYLSIAVPHILYTANVFLTPHQHTGKRSIKGKPTQATIIHKLAAIQRRAALLITCTLRTTATDLIDMLANLIPFHLLVNNYHHAAVLQLATLPPTHPLCKPISNAASRLVKRHPTPLHDLMHRYSLNPAKIEKVQA